MSNITISELCAHESYLESVPTAESELAMGGLSISVSSFFSALPSLRYVNIVEQNNVFGSNNATFINT